MSNLFTIDVYCHGQGWVAVVNHKDVREGDISTTIGRAINNGFKNEATSFTIIVTPK